MENNQINQEQLLALMVEVVQDFNELREKDEQIGTEPDTALFGEASELDSMDLVQLVVAFETRLVESGYTVSLADERAMSQRRSPFASIATLVNYAHELILEA